MNSWICLAEISDLDVVLFASLILLVFLGFIAFFVFSAWVTRHQTGVSPFSGLPLRRGDDLPYEGAKKVLQFLYDRHEYDNRIFDIKRAAVCRETGRVFPNCISWFNTVSVDWSYPPKRFPGNYVSWGSLTYEQQEAIRKIHDSLEGFQTEQSSANSAPSQIEPEFAFLKPGPLYVDVDTKVLLGWQEVPDSDFEVLIVQKPRKKF